VFPLQIYLGPIEVNLYTALIGLAVLLILGWHDWRKGQSGWQIIALGLLGILAGRIGYVALHWDYFADHRSDITALMNQPGYAEHTAWLAVWLMALLWQRLPTRFGRLDTLLIVVMASTIGMGASLGCIPNGCAYGREVFWQDGIRSLGWLLRVDWPDAFSIANPRWPTQLLMPGWLLICAVACFVCQRRSKDSSPSNLLLHLWTVMFAAGDFIIQLYRGDDALYIRNFRIQQYFDVILFILSLYMLIHSYPHDRPHT